MVTSANTPISSLVEPPEMAVDVGESSTVLVRRLEQAGQQTALVTDGGKPVGVVRLAAARSEAADDRRVGEMTIESLPVVLQDTMTAQDITDIADAGAMERLPVVNAEGLLIGEVPRSKLQTGGTLSSNETATVVTETTLGEPVPISVKIGQDVIGSNGHKIGTVKDVLVEANNGRISHFIVQEGAIFKHERKINVELINPDGGTDAVHLKVDKEDIDRLGDLTET